MRKRSIAKSIAARTSVKRYVRHNLGFKAPRGMGWLTDPKKAAYNRSYYRRRKAEDALVAALVGIVIVVGIFLIKLAFEITIYILSNSYFLTKQWYHQYKNKQSGVGGHVKASNEEHVIEQVSGAKFKNLDGNDLPNLALKYVDAKGDLTDRNIKVLSIRETVDGNKVIIAYCALRGERRTFRLDRIKDCFDTDTGECVEDVWLYIESRIGRQKQSA